MSNLYNLMVKLVDHIELGLWSFAFTLKFQSLIILILIWFLINAVLAYYLNLAPDEAYYWVWSNYLNFGYFDHPPLIALLIRMGYLIFKNELGVRLFTIIISTLTIFIVYHLLNKKDVILFSLLIFSNLLLNVGGFIAVPDTALVFSSALFFYFLREYLKNDNFKNVILLSIAIALMLYSKYHGILIILFTLITVPKIALRKSFYIIFLFSFLLYLPHIIWQFQNDFITIKYQLFKRVGIGFHLNNVLDYVIDQFLVYGPIVSFITITLGFLYKPRDEFERILKFNLILTFLFFFIMSFRNRIEANWTCIVLVPLIVLSYNYIISMKKLKMIFYYIAILNTILILLIKFHALFPILKLENDPTSQFRNWKAFAQDIKKIAKDDEICATNYQLSSELYFYLNKKVSFVNIQSRENQFSLWRFKVDCKYIVSHVKFGSVIDSLNAPYLGRVYVLSLK